MSNIDEYGTLFIGGFCKTLGDLRKIVERANYYGLSDETRCNAAVSVRAESRKPWSEAVPGGAGRTVLFAPEVSDAE